MGRTAPPFLKRYHNFSIKPYREYHNKDSTLLRKERASSNHTTKYIIIRLGSRRDPNVFYERFGSSDENDLKVRRLEMSTPKINNATGAGAGLGIWETVLNLLTIKKQSLTEGYRSFLNYGKLQNIIKKTSRVLIIDRIVSGRCRVINLTASFSPRK